jgi:hypothetical protein
MKIKLKVDVLVEPKHGLTAGRVFDVVKEEGNKYYVIGDIGEQCAVLSREFDVIPEVTNGTE